MDLDIHLQIKPSEICLSELIVLSLLSNKHFKEIKAIHRNLETNIIEIIESLEAKEYIKIIDVFIDTEEGDFHLDSISLREKALELVEDKSVDLHRLIDEFRALFPPTFRGDLSGCKVKMKTFLAKYKHITPEIILKATKEYNDYITKTNGYRRQAHYFIIKDGISDLARYCELIVKNELPATVIGDTSKKL